MFKNIYLVSICLIGISLSTTAHAQKDAALVTTASGTATWQVVGGRPNPMQSCMKLRVGDQTEVKAGARLQLVYLESGEVELWDGPANFVIGTARTQQITSGTPTTRKLPLSMVERMARAPEVMTDIRNRAGVVVTRGLPNKKLVDEARENYARARVGLPTEDITPELDLFLVYRQQRMFKEASVVADDMLARAPDDPVVRELVERLHEGRKGGATK